MASQKGTSHVLSVDFWRLDALTFHSMLQEIETESELEEERVPTPEVMKKEDEDLDTDQVRAPCPIQTNEETKKRRKKDEESSLRIFTLTRRSPTYPIHHSLGTSQIYCLGKRNFVCYSCLGLLDC